MSAAEKLKALDERLTYKRWPTDGMYMLEPTGNEARTIARVRNALPQIVAVVEAAETTPVAVAFVRDIDGNLEPEAQETFGEVLVSALAALDEALS